MTSVTVSPKFQIVIPLEIRERLQIKPGQKLYIYEREGKLHLDMPRPIIALRGIARGIRWEDEDRDRHDRY
jgi:AbrB family looped-hinge helix DNA binding protein